MKKFLLLILFFIIVLAVVIFSIPALRTIIFNRELRNEAISLIHLNSSGDGLVTSAGNQHTSQPGREPDIGRIKEELVGKQIPGWNFDKVTEFKQAKISSIARTDQRIDYRIDLHMLPYDAKDESFYDAQIIATYVTDEDGFHLDKVEEIFLSYSIQLPPGKWVSVGSVPGCNLQPVAETRLRWTSKTWDYEIIGGPGDDGLTLPQASGYEVLSKAKHSISVKLTFRPGS